MKKLLVLAALVALCSTSAFAAITNTKHDLSSSSTAAIKGTSTEICVYCHTPHGATAAGTAPLWNRTTTAATDFYNNPAGSINGTMGLAGVNASDAILCLSCHDGASLTDALTNPPNSGGAVPAVQTGAAANLGTDLSNDHPVGFNYLTTAADTEINAAPVGVKVTYGTGNDMWCSSCHDVHSNTFSPFLAKSNVGSALCLTCHVK